MRIIYLSGEDYVALQFEDYVQQHFEGSVTDALRAYDNGEGDLEPFKFANILEFDQNIPIPFIRFVKDQLLDYDQGKHENIYYEGEII